MIKYEKSQLHYESDDYSSDEEENFSEDINGEVVNCLMVL